MLAQTRGTGTFVYRFHLSMQILVDRLISTYPNIEAYGLSTDPILEGVRAFSYGIKPQAKFIYLITPEDMAHPSFSYPPMSLVVLGRPRHQLFRSHHSVIVLPDATDSLKVFDLLQQTFELYRQWDYTLQTAQNSSQPLHDMLQVSKEIFKNPILCHDANFYVLSSVEQRTELLLWERNPRTNWLQIPTETINTLKLDRDYVDSLTKKEPGIFKDSIRGHRTLFVNLWKGDTLEGRICIDEQQSSIQSGQLWALSYLGHCIEQAMMRQTLFQLYSGNPLEEFFSEFLDGTIHESHEVLNALFLLHWKRDDHYLCLQLSTIQANAKFYSATATLGQIESQLSASKAFMHHQNIVVIINLTCGGQTVSQVATSMAMIQRQGLFRMGVSGEIHDFFSVSQGYTQTSIALELGEKHANTIWCHHFDDHVVDYMLEQATKAVSPRMLCAQAVFVIQEYDVTNGTQLLQTLQVLLEHEQNLQKTANALYIHRSTLLYRLERVRQLTHIDLNNPKERLRLELSFALLDINPDLHNRQPLIAE